MRHSKSDTELTKTDVQNEMAKLNKIVSTIRQLNEFDVDQLVSSMLHGVTQENFDNYRNGIHFMQDMLNVVLKSEGNTDAASRRRGGDSR
jgi:Asp-tRNA(Asn)/Glu-tRNA(Gln) amidotransferase C subunit